MSVGSDPLPSSRENFKSWGQVNNHLLKHIIPFMRGKVLDAGCASGGYTIALRQRGINIQGCDLFKWAQWGDTIIGNVCQANLVNLPFADKSFDTILCLNVLEHIREIQVVLQQFRRICRGRLVISVPNCESYPVMGLAGLTFNHWEDQSHVHFFKADSLKNLLVNTGMTVESVQTFGTVRPETMFLRSLGLPMYFARAGAKVLQMIPWRRRFSPLLLTVVKVQD